MPNSRFNFFFGPNGSGKTSLLESIYFLGVGRSFRTHLAQRLIQHTADYFSVYLTIQEREQITPIGVERYKSGSRHLKIDRETVSNWSHLAKRLPLCLISATMSHRFLVDGPKVRRQFFDWLLFHVEPSFFSAWRRIQRSLKQRNAALKTRRSLDESSYWEDILTEEAEYVHKLREVLVLEFTSCLNQILHHFLPNYSLALSYYRGWNDKSSLAQQLQAYSDQDLRRGYTQVGPHRANFQILIDGLSAQDVLSQGQQKLVIYALYMAQGLLLKKKTGINPVYLLDDFSSELDTNKKRCVIDLLTHLKSQVFITGTSIEEIDIPDRSTTFYIKCGICSPY